ncbi:conserved hypothetical protein [uncultured Gammaproteobacteria bacterium]
MGYRLSRGEIYDMSFKQDVFDDPRKNPLSEMEFADPSSVDGIALNESSRGVLMEHGYPVKTETAPKKFLWGGGKRKLPEILGFQQILIINDRFKNFVEQFDPGIHQFIPVDVYKAKAGEPVAKYYWFNVLARVDTVDAQLTTCKLMPSYGGTAFWTDQDENFQRFPGAKIVFDDGKAAGHHVWVEPTLLVGRPYHCSTAFGETAIAANFTGLVITPRSSLHMCRAE